MKKFLWGNEENGEAIEEFLLTLCDAVPGVAKEILGLGFGDLRGWYNGSFDTTWKNAKCGCLVGQFSVIGQKRVEGCLTLLETHYTDDTLMDVSQSRGAVETLYMAIAAATKRQIHAYELDIANDPLYQLIERVGYSVGDECSGSVFGDVWVDSNVRTQDVGRYMLDFIRVVLTDMGYTNLPKSPARACKLESYY